MMDGTFNGSQWLLCLGCGAWQQKLTPCFSCGWKQLALANKVGQVDSSGYQINGAVIRVLVEIEVTFDGAINVSRLHTDRLLQIRHNAGLISKLDKEVKKRFTQALPNEKVWLDLRAESKHLLESTINEMLRPRWPGKPSSSNVPVELCFRILELNPDVVSWIPYFPWIEVVPLNDALSEAGKNLKDHDLKVDLHGSKICLDQGGDRLRLSLLPPTELMTSEFSLWMINEKSVKIWSVLESAILNRSNFNSVFDRTLPANVQWTLAPEISGISPKLELRIGIHGREDKQYQIEVPCGDLGHKAQLVDIFLDLGSTTTKFIVRVGDTFMQPQTKRTSSLVSEWALPPYEKSRFLADKTGEAWANWVSELLSALRKHAATKHRGYLRGLHLTLPQSGVFAVHELAEYVSKGITTEKPPKNFDSNALIKLSKRASIDAVGNRVLVLRAEHEAIARHYLEPLRILHEAAKTYHGTYGAREDLRSSESCHQKDWDGKKSKQKEFDNSFFLYRWFNRRPDGPSGSRPSISPALTNPEEWMRNLIKNADLLNYVVLLDAGGLSLDIAIIEEDTIVENLGYSNATCGGESITIQLADILNIDDIDSDDWTREKARLGDLWCKPSNKFDIPLEERLKQFGGRDQIAYREITRTTYCPVIAELVTSCANRWSQKASTCTILLTGGGSQNPHFQELVNECVYNAGLIASVMDARGIQAILDEAKMFKQPLPELESPVLAMFSKVNSWASNEVQGAGHMVYDKFAVVGGLIAEAMLL